MKATLLIILSFTLSENDVVIDEKLNSYKSTGKKIGSHIGGASGSALGSTLGLAPGVIGGAIGAELGESIGDSLAEDAYEIDTRGTIDNIPTEQYPSIMEN